MIKSIPLLLLFFLMCSACSDEAPQIPSVQQSHWDKSSLQRQALNGPVSAVTEYKESDGMRFILSVTSYDRNGNILEYLPVNNFEDSYASPRWVPQISKTFRYEYEQDRLVRIHVSDHADPSVTYTLRYGQNGRYAIVDLDMKPNTPLLIKDLIAVESSDGSYNLSWEGDRMQISSVNIDLTVETEYKYETSLYPTESLTRTTGPDGVKTIKTVWSYHEGGAFREIQSVSEQEGSAFNEIIRYNSDGFMLSDIQTGDLSKQMHYSYNSRNYLTTISHRDKFDDEIGSMNAIYDLDTHKNWIRQEYTVKGFIDWDMREGTEVINRNIIYFQ